MSLIEFSEWMARPSPIVDVRAPVEFTQGSIPGSVNLPILNDVERAAVGTCFKNEGQAAALALGTQLVSGEIREERIAHWKKFITENPNAILTCFRGGLRSQIAQSWLSEAGVSVPRLAGGFKESRAQLMTVISEFSRRAKLVVIAGPTGSGKTKLLRSHSVAPRALDLEKLAHHRGSAFGGFPDGQPTQIDFENRMALRMRELSAFDQVIIEDESRLVGHRVQPETLFLNLRESRLVVVDEDLDSRVEETFAEYVAEAPVGRNNDEAGYLALQKSLNAITKRLGGAKTKEIADDLRSAWETQLVKGDLSAHRVWIRKLLHSYYDPIYLGNLKKRAAPVLFQGSRRDCEAFLSQQG